MGLEVKNVTKKYGDKTVVENISFTLDKPGVFGLLGSNGAGKTTTIRMILGILEKNSGEIKWNGKSVKRENVNFGYLPEERGIYPKAKVSEQLEYFARLKGIGKAEAKKAVEQWCKKLEVYGEIDKPAERLSKGNQQKVQLITALIHNPELLILDEPFSGLDPVNTKIIKKVLEELIQKGTYIIMSSHQMAVVEEYCTDILLLTKGKTVLQGNLNKIKKSYGRNNLVVEAEQDISKYLSKDLKVLDKTAEGYELKISSDAQAQELLKTLVDNKVAVKRFEIKEPSLQEIFIEKVGGANE